MLNNADVRKGIAKFIDPVAKKLLDIGVTPDAITYVGTLGVSASALWFFPRGQFTIGVIVILLFVFSDLLDGTMARMSNRAGPWGNFLDSTLDRIADGAVFGGILIYFATQAEPLAVAATWVCLVGGFTISYAKARAESVGATANVGIAERAERLILVLAAAFIAGFGVPWILQGAVLLLAILVLITIGQRFAKVKSQLHPMRTSGAGPDAPADGDDAS